jgi:HTH-type transcriptional regulator / antitoxin HipB
MERKVLATFDDVARVVREHRIALGLTQIDLAQRAGVGRRFVVDLERGHPRAEFAQVLAVLNALGVHAAALPAPPVTKTVDDIDLDKAVARFA